MKGPIYILQGPESPIFTLSCSTATTVFETQAILRQVHQRQMTPKWHCTLEGVPYIHVTTKYPPIPKFQSVLLYGQPFSSYKQFFRQVHPMTPKGPWTLKGLRYLIYMLQLPQSPTFHSVSFHGQPFSSYRPYWDKCTQWPQNDLEH